jgi:hypothetical protein
MAQQILLRRGTAVEWTAANPILAEGEMGLEKDTNKYKIGNGITNWNGLEYSSLPADVYTKDQSVVRHDNEAIDLDNLGDVRARSIDVDNLPKICGFDMFVISTTAPSVAPDFIPQIWVDTTAKKAYIAVGVSTADDFIALN